MVLLAIFVTMNGQTTIKGTLTDKNTGEGEPFATVRVFKEGNDKKPVAMFLTDVEGNFSENVSGKGKHVIVFTSVGKEDVKKNIVLGESTTIDLGVLQTKENAEMLKGVEVVAQKPLVKMEVDKMSYKVEDDADSKTSTVLDMLRKVPMVTVDGQDNISVNGSSSFKVYVDGKPNVMFSSNPSMIFKSMPAAAVKSIEVITNPGAKYDAEGASGVLNIIMNKQNPQAMQSMDGYTGTIRAAASNKAVGGGVFLSGQKGKLSYSANVMENYNQPGTTETEIEQQNGDDITTTLSKTKTKVPFTMGNVSLGYELDSMSSINATASVTALNMKNDGSYTTTMSGKKAGSGFDYVSNTNMKNSRTSFSGSLDYQRFFNRERTKSVVLTYQLDYSPSTNKQRNDFNVGSTDFINLTDRYSENKEKTTDHTFQVDYTTPLLSGHTLNLGAKGMTRKATSDAKYYLDDVYNASMSMDYEYRNTILAGYAEYEAKWNNVGAKAGLRYEQTWQDVEYHLGNGVDFSKNYGNLVPSASLSYSIAPTQNIGLTYNLRISRPGITYLNPYVDRSNPTALTKGNTDLEVEKANNFALVYNSFSPKLMMNVSLKHSYTGNAIQQYSYLGTSTDEKDLLVTTYGNIVKTNQTGLSAYASWLALKDTRIFINGGVTYNDMRSDALNLKNSGWQANAMVGLQQTLPWDLKLGAYLITSTKTYTLQGWSSGFNLLTGSISKSLLNDKLTIGVQALTGLSKGGNLVMETYSKGENFSNHTNIKVPISMVALNVTFNIGNTNRRAATHTSRVQNDYIEQKSQGEIINNIGQEGQ